MSRTYRRKNVKCSHKNPWGTSYGWTWEWNGHFVYKRRLEGKEFKKDKALYHADHCAGYFNAPKWFRKELNQTRRAKNKEILSRAIRECNDEPMFIPDKNMANWEWW